MTQTLISTLNWRENTLWLNEAARLPLGFAQVREDARLDLEVARRIRANADICLVASGGCTATYLAACAAAKSICLVDTNEAQLALSRVKLYLLESESVEARLALLGHQAMDENQRLNQVTAICEKLKIRPENIAPLKMIANHGIDYSGRYELLFARLQSSLACWQTELDFFLSLNDVSQQGRFAEESGLGNAFNQAFNDIFALTNLLPLFGEQATQNALKPFALHFRERLQCVIENLPNASNPYLHQLLAGRYGDAPAPWLLCNQTKVSARLDFAHVQMGVFLETKKSMF